MMVYCLFQELCDENGNIKNWDLFGVYSTKKKAEQAMEWVKNGDGTFWGCSPEYIYNRCVIDTRIIDCNLPEEETL